jgi:glucose-6-phosphate 1-dehydrogenase
MSTDQVDALVIFGATGDLAKLETFPALVGLAERGVLDVPVIGVAKSGCSGGSPRASPRPDGRPEAGSWWRSRSAPTWPVPSS